MLSESERYRYECEGKRRYSAKSDAKRSQSRAKSLGGDNLKIYRCSWCGGFHAGHAGTAPWLTGAQA